MARRHRKAGIMYLKLFVIAPKGIASVKEALLIPTSAVVAFASEIEAMEQSIQLGFKSNRILACEFDSQQKIRSSSLIIDTVTRRQSWGILSLAEQAGCKKLPSSFEGSSVLTAFESFRSIILSAKKRGFVLASLLAEFCRIVKSDAVYADSDCTKIVVMNPFCVKSFDPWRKDGDILPIFEHFESRGVKVAERYERDSVSGTLYGTYFAPAKEAFGIARFAHGEVCDDAVSSLRCVSDVSDEAGNRYQVRYVDGSIVMAPALPWQLHGEGGYEDEPLSSFMAWDDKDFSRIVDIVEQYHDGDGEFVFRKVYDREEDMDDIEGCRHLFASRPAVKAEEKDSRFSLMFDRELSIRYDR